ncbi:MAG TPA: R3H domain-containing nucleic acid-binding protein [Candidatus Binatia bacterium]|jgi:spoIIIJ-associated protein|nr:R3H domain-containing nucleic acid-binding protein [Candidatus Binatia bacterium]
MPITDKIAAAKKISELLNGIIATGDFHLRYKIMVDPPAVDQEFSHPDIKVELSGADSPLVKERGGELLRAFEQVALEMLRLGPDEHDKVVFDCENFRAARMQELRLSANHAAERVRESGMPYAFAPMSSRERRIVHLALRDLQDLRTESAGEALQRYVVVYPKDYKGKPPAPAPSRRR